MYWPHQEETPIIPSSGHSIQTPCIKQNIIHSQTLYIIQYFPSTMWTAADVTSALYVLSYKKLHDTQLTCCVFATSV